MAPDDAFSVKPGGSAPALTEKLYGEVPPDTLMVCEYAVPPFPSRSELVVMLGAGLMTTVYACDPLDSRSAAVTVNLYVPEVPGVPLITPEPSNENPGGSVPVA